MKGVKGKFLKKFKTIKTIGYLKPDRILHVNAGDGIVDNFFAKSSNKCETHSAPVEGQQIDKKSSVPVQEHEIIDVSELMKDLQDDDGSDTDSVVEDKENVRPVSDPVADQKLVHTNSKSLAANPLSEIDISIFRPPDLNSVTLFDPNLLAAFEQAVLQVKAQEARALQNIEDFLDKESEPEPEPPLKSLKVEEIHNPLSGFEKICPPGGGNSVILYTTGFRSIRKTFEDCSSIRFLLESFRVQYQERDLSMHLDFRDELWRILGGKVAPPRLFIKGRYIGGAEEVLRLHEQGKFRPLLAEMPLNMKEGPCQGCAGVRFVVCCNCSGSRKVDSGDERLPEKCTECNENGLIRCPICC